MIFGCLKRGIPSIYGNFIAFFVAILRGNMIIWMDLALLYFWLTHPFYWDWMIGSCEIHLNVAVDLFYLLIFDVWLRGTLRDISWRMGSSSIVIASAQGIFPVDTWPRFDDSLEVCYCDFIQLCGKFLWLTFDIITNYRGIHKQANVLRRYGVCVCEFIWICISHAIPIDIFNTSIFSWSAGKNPFLDNPRSVLSQTYPLFTNPSILLLYMCIYIWL